MEILIIILVIAIIVLAITCYSMFEMNKEAFERVLNLTVNYHSIVGERNAFENESKILEILFIINKSSLDNFVYDIIYIPSCKD